MGKYFIFFIFFQEHLMKNWISTLSLSSVNVNENQIFSLREHQLTLKMPIKAKQYS